MNFAVVTTLSALPGECRVCGSSSREWYLDTGIQEEFYGAVVYCSTCIGFMADLCGFLAPADRKRFMDKIDELEQEIVQLKITNDGYRDIKNGLETLRSSDSPGFHSTIDPSDGSSSGIETVESTDDDVSGDSPQPGVGERTPDESSHVEGLGELRPSDELDDFKLSI